MGRCLEGTTHCGVRWKTVSAAHLVAELGDHLNAGRAGADHADALAAEVDVLLGPARGVVDVALETVHAGEVRDLGRGEQAHGLDEELRAPGLAVVGRDRPPAGLVVPGGGLDLGVELDAATQVVAVGDVLEVGPDLLLARVALGPLPLVEELLVEGVAVGVDLGVGTSARVLVPVPGASHVAGVLERLDGEPVDVPQPVDAVEPGESRADDDRVDLRGPALRLDLVAHRACPFSSSGARVRSADGQAHRAEQGQARVVPFRDETATAR